MNEMATELAIESGIGIGIGIETKTGTGTEINLECCLRCDKGRPWINGRARSR